MGPGFLFWNYIRTIELGAQVARHPMPANKKTRHLGCTGPGLFMSELEEASMAKKRKSSSGAKRTGRKGTKRRKAAKRELIRTGRDARFVRRRAKGRFKESDDVGRSLRTDRRKKAKRKVRSGYGDKGDR